MSLLNKMEEIRLSITHSMKLLNCNVMIFMETLLHSGIPDKATELAERHTSVVVLEIGLFKGLGLVSESTAFLLGLDLIFTPNPHIASHSTRESGRQAGKLCHHRDRGCRRDVSQMFCYTIWLPKPQRDHL
ncbi:uncharacterized protein LOC118312363 isoform X1 [Tachysurus ichikawai]